MNLVFTTAFNENGAEGTWDILYVIEGVESFTNDEITAFLMEKYCVFTGGTQLTPSSRDCTGRTWASPVAICCTEHRAFVTQHWQTDI